MHAVPPKLPSSTYPQELYVSMTLPPFPGMVSLPTAVNLSEDDQPPDEGVFWLRWFGDSIFEAAPGIG